MQDPAGKLTIFHDDNGVFNEGSDSLLDYGRDDFAMELISAEDYLYVGYSKPINRFYVELSTANTNTNEFTVEYYNGTAFTNVSKLKDDTLGFTRSGFIQWERSDADSEDTATTVNSVELYWYRLKPDADHSAGTTLRGLNLLLSDDEDLRGIVPEVNSFRNKNEASFVLTHQAIRNDIIQRIRNMGRQAEQNINTTGGANNTFVRLRNINQWDLLESFEVRQASVYFVLAQIFFNASDRSDDKYYQRYLDFKAKAENQLKLFFITIDQDDDGLVDNPERRLMGPIMQRRY